MRIRQKTRYVNRSVGSKAVLAAVAALCTLSMARTAHALGSFQIVIVPNSDLAANPNALAAFNRAAAEWESYISDPITVTIDAGLAHLGSTILGQTSTVTLSNNYSTIRNLLVNDASNEFDDGVVAALPATNALFNTTLPTGFTRNGTLTFTKANAKALGVTNLDAQFGASDATINFSEDYNFDYDNSNGITAGAYDFQSVAAHEIGHALGFISEVDTIDTAIHNGQTSNAVSPSTMDLFRFSNTNDPSTLADFTTTARDLVPGDVDHFDQITNIFGGATEVLDSTGAYTGDGNQASHWKDNLGLGIMDPTLASGEISSISANDLRALDLIGYEITVVPEPGVMMPLVAAGLLALRRRR